MHFLGRRTSLLPCGTCCLRRDTHVFYHSISSLSRFFSFLLHVFSSFFTHFPAPLGNNIIIFTFSAHKLFYILISIDSNGQKSFFSPSFCPFFHLFSKKFLNCGHWKPLHGSFCPLSLCFRRFTPQKWAPVAASRPPVPTLPLVLHFYTGLFPRTSSNAMTLPPCSLDCSAASAQ